mgnify:CR=1 FL=1
MIKRIALLILVIVCFASCKSDYTYKIEGELTNLSDQTIYAVFENDNARLVDTVTCKKPGEFTLKEKKDGFNCVTLFFDGKSRYVTAYLEKGKTVSISGDARYPMGLKITGGKINNDLNDFRKKASKLIQMAAEINNQIYEKSATSSKETDLTAKVANINLQISEMAESYIKDHKNKQASVVLIERYFSNPEDTRKIDELLAMLDPKLKSFYLFTNLQQFSARAKRTAIGAEAPNFSVRNVYGRAVSIDSFPQRYLLMAFTAPWCDMCQTKDLELDKIAMKYPSKKLSILLISLDNDQKQVRNALKNDSIRWNLVTDSAGQATNLIDLYNVSALPRRFLIDEEGKIIQKADNGMEIRQTLERLLDKDTE